MWRKLCHEIDGKPARLQAGFRTRANRLCESSGVPFLLAKTNASTDAAFRYSDNSRRSEGPIGMSRTLLLDLGEERLPS